MRPDMARTHTSLTTLYDLKTLTDNPSHNPTSVLRQCHTKHCSVVERHQEQVHKEYIRKAEGVMMNGWLK